MRTTIHTVFQVVSLRREGMLAAVAAGLLTLSACTTATPEPSPSVRIVQPADGATVRRWEPPSR